VVVIVMALEDTTFAGKISLDFEQAINQAQEFSNKIDLLSQKFEKLSQQTGISRDSILDLIKEEVQKINSGKLNIDIAPALEKKVNKAIADYFAQDFNLQIVGNKTLTETQTRQIANKARDVLVDAIKKVNLNIPKLGNVELSSKNLNDLKLNIEQQINEKLKLQNFISIDKNLSIEATNDTVEKLYQQVNEAITNKINEIFEPFQKVNIIQGETVKFNIEKFNEVVKELENMVSSINKELDDLKPISNYDLVVKSFANFKEDEELLIQNIVEVASLLNNFTQQAKSTFIVDLRNILSSINNKVLVQMDSDLKSLNEKILQLPVGSIKTASYLNSVKKIQNIVKNGISNRIKLLIDEYESALNTVFVDIGGVEVGVSSLKTLKNKLTTAVNKALKTVDFSTLGVNSKDIEDLIQEWSNKSTEDLKATVKDILESSDALIVAYKEIYDIIFDSISQFVNNTHNSIGESTGSEKRVINISEKEIQQLMEDKLRNLIKSAILNSEISISENFDIKVNLDKVDLQKISEFLNDIIYSYTSKLLEGLNIDIQSRVSTSVNDVKKYFDTSINVILNNIVLNIEQGVLNLILDISKIDLKSQLNEYRVSFIEKYREEVENFVINFKSGIENAVVIITSISKLTSDLEKQVQAVIDENKSKIISKERIDYNFNFDTSLQQMVKKLEQIIKNTLRTSIDYNSISVDVEPIKSAFDSSIKNIVNKYSKKIKDDISNNIKSFAETGNSVGEGSVDVSRVITQLDNSVNKYFTNYVKLISKTVASSGTENIKIPINSLLPEVRRELANYFDTTVRELQTSMKTLEGEEGLNFVVQKNIEVVVDKFNSTLMSVLNKVTKEHVNALDNVSVSPSESVVEYLRKKMLDLQSDIVKKVKKMIDNQFKLLKSEINGLTVAPTSLSSTTVSSKALSNNVSKQVSAGISSSSYKGSITSTELDSILNKYLGESSNPESGWALTYKNMHGAILNTIRYMTAGALVGLPSLLLGQGYTSAVSFDNYLEMARQNFLMKDSTMRSVAEQVINEKYQNKEISASQYNDKAEREKLIQETANDLVRMTRDEVVKQLQNVAVTYGLKQEDVGQAWYIASRRIDNPYEALDVTKSISKLFSFERDSNPEDLATGMEAILSQWGLSGYSASKVADMLIKADAMSQASVEDLLQIQQRAGAVFAQNMPGASKQDALATSLALSSLFVQATARSGSDAGTFWKTVFSAPFTGRHAEYLRTLSTQPGLEMLSPFVKTTLPNGKVVEEQKQGLQMFIDILTAMKKMTAEDRQNLIYKVYGQTFGYGVEALQAVMNDINNVAGSGKNIQDYINAIKNVREEDIIQAVVARQGTWAYNQQKLATEWDSAVFSIVDQFKSEFSVYVGDLSKILRVVSDNADTIAQLFKVGVKVLEVWLAKWAVNKGSEAINSYYNKHLNKQAKEDFEVINANVVSKNLQKQSLYEDINRYQQGIFTVEKRKAEIQEPYNKYFNARNEIADKINKASKTLIELKSSPEQTEATLREIQKTERYIQSLEKEYDRVSKEAERYEKQLDTLSRMQDRYSSAIEETKSKIEQLDQELNNITNQAIILDKAYQELGEKGFSLTQTVLRLNNQIENGTFSFKELDLEISKLGKNLGVSEYNIKSFSNDVALLVDRLNSGEISAKEFALALKQLERAYNLSKFGVGNPTASAEELINNITAREMLRNNSKNTKENISNSNSEGNTVLSTVATSVGLTLVEKLLGRKGGVKVAEEVGEDALKVASKEGLLTKLGAGAKGIFNVIKDSKLIGSATNLFKFLGKDTLQGLLISAGLSIGGGLLDAFTSTQSEKLSSKANKEQVMLNTVNNISNSGFLGKLIGGANLAYDTLINGLVGTIGGNAPTFGDYFKAWGALLSSNKDALDKYTELERQNIAKLTAKSESLQEKEQKDSELQQKTGQMSDGTEVQIQNLTERYDIMLSDLQTQFKTNQAKLYIKGYEQDSKEMRDLMENFIKNNIDLLQKAISDLEQQKKSIEEQYPNSYQSDSNWQSINNTLNNYKQQLAEQQMSLEDTKFSQYDEIVNKLNQNKSLVEAQFGVQKSNAILQGAGEDSAIINNIEKNQLLTENKYISQAISQLNDLMNSYAEGDSRRDKIFLEIAQLQAESKDNLVKIYNTLAGNKSTFNLPSDIQPITYWEAATKANSLNNVTVRSGDVIVNMNINNMSGSQKDIQNITDAISNTIRNIQSGLANSLANQVKSGMASSYRPI
jgi:hypothetical protein